MLSRICCDINSLSLSLSLQSFSYLPYNEAHNDYANEKSCLLFQVFTPASSWPYFFVERSATICCRPIFLAACSSLWLGSHCSFHLVRKIHLYTETIFLKKMGQSRPLFVYFRPRSYGGRPIQQQNVNGYSKDEDAT